MLNPTDPVDQFALTAQAAAVVEFLEMAVRDRATLLDIEPDLRRKLLMLAGAVSRPDAARRRQVIKESRKRKGAERRRMLDEFEAQLHATGIRELRRQPVFNTPNYFLSGEIPQETVDDPDFREAVESKHCYVCKEHYTRIHHFYDQLCPGCAAFNYAKRAELADLTGRVALLTGGRVKIGYQAGIKLLRAGAHLIVTTRFPRDSAARYAGEPDFEQWGHRLEIYGLDLRHTPSVEAFCHQLNATHRQLDFIVNNACQTVRRPPDFYRHMMERETAVASSMPEHERKLLGAYEGVRAYNMLPAATRSQMPLLPDETTPQAHLFPKGMLDQDLQQVDLRDRNSWRMLMADVPAVELLEVQLVNAVAPFLINARLKPLMLRTATRDKHIVNVSAVEGQFYRRHKTTRHPHTNMAKAALNMMTRTSAADYQAGGIHMNAVDTGWVTDEDPAAIAARKVVDHRFHPPLDIVDGAARIVDPIMDGINTGNHSWGQFLKDYKPTDW